MQIHNAIITGSFSYNGADLSNVTSSNAYSASLSSRTTDLESTSSVLVGASSSFSSILSSVSSSQQQISSSLLQVSASYIALSGSYNIFSGSASTRVTQIEQVYATTGSNSFRADQSITGSLTVTGQIIAQTINVQQVTSSIVYSSGSNIFGCDLNSRQTFTGSVLITGSLTIAGASSATSYSGTTIYGSTAVCSAVGKFSTCIDVSGTGRFYQPLTNSTSYLVVENNRARNAAVYTATTNGGFYAGTSIGTDTFNYQIYDGVVGAARLTIASTGAATFACSVNAVDYYKVTGAGPWVSLFDTQGSSKNWAIRTGHDAVGDLAFRQSNSTSGDPINAGTTRLYINATGNVGIGTSSTTCRRLTIFGESTCVRGIAFRGCATGDGGNIFLEGYDTDDNEYSNFEFVPNSGNGYFAFNSGAGSNCNNWTQNTRMVIGTSGRVGIGTCTPSAALNVSCVPSSYFGIIETTGTSTGTVKHFRVHKPNCVEYGIGILADNAFHISTASTFPTSNGFTIATNGFVGIGQQAPGGRLEIMNCSATTWSIIARHAVSSGTIYGILSTIQNQAPNNTSSYLFYGDDNVQARMIVYSNGTVSNATGTYNTIASDIRLKQDITNASSQWCDIKNLRLVNFRFKKDVENEGEGALRHLGLIAQEVEETSPNLVEEVTDRCGSTHKTIKTSIIHLKAVKALQEAMCRIEMQQETINMLKTCLGIN